MSDKFQNKYRIPSTRLQNWDYGSNARYFITICTSQMEYYFGDIHDGEMDLSEIGIIANTYWKEIPDHFPIGVLGEFVVMPNHMHGIISIDGDGRYDGCDGRDGGWDGRDGGCDGGCDGRDAINRVSTEPEPEPEPQPEPATMMAAPLPTSFQHITETHPGGITGNKNPMLNNNLSRIIRWYKGRVTFESHKIHHGFAWQSRFHDHIIRNDESFQRISNYIKNNPSKWSEDKFFKP